MNTSSFSHGVNLLPDTTKRKFAALYYTRLFSIFIFLIALGVAMSGALLVPSYLLANAQADAAERYLAASQKSVNLGAQGGASGMFALLTERLSILTDYLRRSVTGPVLSALSGRLVKGVSVTKIAITLTGNGAGTVSVSGEAGTRDALLRFVASLQGAELFQRVSVPVSDLANEADIFFTLSFSFVLPRS
ncbi:MAG: hypothetical protein Q7R74_01025 [bacterium]|nr:hypothetical protein [bacterium]